MSTQKFHPFPRLPPEIRHLIWTFALPPPRLVHIKSTAITRFYHTHQENNPYMNQNLTKLPTDYLHSTSPIPYLLHTTRESRAAMRLLGYELAFSSPTTGPRTWFNFTHDILYLSQHLHRSILLLSTLRYGMWYLQQFSLSDLCQVRKVALCLGCLWYHAKHPKNVLWHEKNPHFLTPILMVFGGLEELLYVETHCGEIIQCLRNPVPDRRDDPWEVLDCDVGQPVRVCGSEDRELMIKYSRQITEFRRENGTEIPLPFFRHLETEIEVRLVGERDAAVKRGRTRWAVPKVSMVQVMRRSEKRRLVGRRELYWMKMMVLERRESVCGVKPPDDFEIRWADDLEAEFEVAILY